MTSRGARKEGPAGRLVHRIVRHIASRQTSGAELYGSAAGGVYISRATFAKGLESVGIFLERDGMSAVVRVLGSDAKGRGVAWQRLDELGDASDDTLADSPSTDDASKFWGSDGLPRVCTPRIGAKAHAAKSAWTLRSQRELVPVSVPSPTSMDRQSPLTSFGPGLPYSLRGRSAALYARARANPEARRLINIVRRAAHRHAVSASELFARASRDGQRGSATHMHRIQLVRTFRAALKVFLTLDESKLLISLLANRSLPASRGGGAEAAASAAEDAVAVPPGEVSWFQFQALFGDAHETMSEHVQALDQDNVLRIVRHLIAAGYTTGGVDLACLFDHLHLSRHNALRYGDFEHAVRRSHVSYERPSGDALRSLFTLIDVNGDGHISLTEFTHFVRTTARANGIEFREKAAGVGVRRGATPRRAAPPPRASASAAERVAQRVRRELHRRAIVASDLFRRIDVDSSSRVHRLELIRGLASVGIRLTGSDNATLFAHLDSDGDGSIDWGEFKELLHGDGADESGRRRGTCTAQQRQRAPLPPLQVAKAVAQLRVAAYRAGGVDLEHFFSVLWSKRRAAGLSLLDFRRGLRRARVGHDCLCDAEIAQLFADVDVNGDGRVELSEFVSYVHRSAAATGAVFQQRRVPLRTASEASETKLLLANLHAPRADGMLPAWQRTMHRVMRELHHKAIVVSDLFHRIDVDGSAFVHRLEFARGLDAVGVHLNPIESAELFDALDANGDGRIDWSEFQQLYEAHPERAAQRVGRGRDCGAPASQRTVVDIARRLRSAAHVRGGVSVERIFPQGTMRLTLKRFVAGVRRAGVDREKISRGELAALFATLDKERVGVVLVDDFLAFDRAHQTHASAVVATRRVVDELVRGPRAKAMAQRQRRLDARLVAAVRRPEPVERVEDIIARGANVNSRATRLMTTPLHFAAEGGSAAVVQRLVAAGASATERDQYSLRPSAWARHCGHDALAMYLEECEREQEYVRSTAAKHGRREGAVAGLNRGLSANAARACTQQRRGSGALHRCFIAIDHWEEVPPRRSARGVSDDAVACESDSVSDGARVLVATRDTYLKRKPIALLGARFVDDVTIDGGGGERKTSEDGGESTAATNRRGHGSVFVPCGAALPLVGAPETLSARTYGVTARWTHWRIAIAAETVEMLCDERTRFGTQTQPQRSRGAADDVVVYSAPRVNDAAAKLSAFSSSSLTVAQPMPTPFSPESENDYESQGSKGGVSESMSGREGIARANGDAVSSAAVVGTKVDLEPLLTKERASPLCSGFTEDSDASLSMPPPLLDSDALTETDGEDEWKPLALGAASAPAHATTAGARGRPRVDSTAWMAPPMDESGTSEESESDAIDRPRNCSLMPKQMPRIVEHDAYRHSVYSALEARGLAARSLENASGDSAALKAVPKASPKAALKAATEAAPEVASAPIAVGTAHRDSLDDPPVVLERASTKKKKVKKQRRRSSLEMYEEKKAKEEKEKEKKTKTKTKTKARRISLDGSVRTLPTLGKAKASKVKRGQRRKPRNDAIGADPGTVASARAAVAKAHAAAEVEIDNDV